MTGLLSGSDDQHTDKPIANSAPTHMRVGDKARQMTAIVAIIILAERAQHAIRVSQTVARDIGDSTVMPE